MEMLDIVKDVKALKTMILRARYAAAKMANAEMLIAADWKLWYNDVSWR